jgi:hypothetical protein
VSSILDALEKLEATGGPEPPFGGPGGRPRRRWLWPGLFIVAIAVGAGGAALVLGPSAPADGTAAPAEVAAASDRSPAPSTRRRAKPATSEPQAPVAAAPRGAAPVPPPKADDMERPWAWDAEPAGAPEPAPVLAAARAERPAEAPPPPAVEPAAPPAPRIETPPADDLPAGPIDGARPPMGAPRLRVSFLVYSSVAERRSVALTIDGGGLTTMREGEEAQGIAVVRIRPDRVDLRWNGETFTLEVRS